MKLKITFKSVPGFKISYNSNYTIATIIYNALEDNLFLLRSCMMIGVSSFSRSARFKYPNFR